MGKQNLNEEIVRIKQLLNIIESSVIEEANPILGVIKRLAPSLERKFITGIETKIGKKIAQATDAEIETALKSAEMAVIRKEIAQAVYAAEKNMIDGVFAKYNMSVAGEASAAYRELQANGLNKGILRDVASEWKAGKTSGAGAGMGAGSTTSGKQATTFGGGGGLTNLPVRASIDDVMKHIDVDPIFSQVMKAKKGSREMVQNWIEVNLGDNVSVDEIMKKVEPYFERLAKSPDVKTTSFSRRVDKVIEMSKKGDSVWEGSKGFVKWALGLGLVGVVVGAWSANDFLKAIACRFDFGQRVNGWFGCTSGTEQNTNSGGSGEAQKGELN